jgi:hypothetical protein
MIHSRILSTGLLTLFVLLIAAQFVPYGRRHSNPADGTLAAFDSPVTQKLAQRACFDCHSNRTRWPWYASIAPMSWRIQHDVDEGREELNFTAFTSGEEKVAKAAGEAAETVTKGEMPPQDYLLLHPDARLSAQEKEALAKGLSVMFAAFGEKETHGDRVTEDRKAFTADRTERGRNPVGVVSKKRPADADQRGRGEANETDEDRD